MGGPYPTRSTATTKAAAVTVNSAYSEAQLEERKRLLERIEALCERYSTRSDEHVIFRKTLHEEVLRLIYANDFERAYRRIFELHENVR